MQRTEPKIADVWGLNVRYFQTAQGPMALLLHGLPTSLLTWYCNIKVLAEAGYRVIAPDLPSYSDSGEPSHLVYGPNSVADFGQELGLKLFSLVGSSAGGSIPGLFALEHPEMIQRMVLVTSGGFDREVSWFLRIIRIISIPVVDDLVYQPWLNNRFGIPKFLFQRPPAFLKELLLDMNRVKLLPGTRAAMLGSHRSSVNFSGMRNQGLILELLKDPDVPRMTVWNAEDIIIPVSHVKNVRQELLESMVKVIPECGHWPHMENPVQFNPMLTIFLSGGLAQAPQQEP